MRVSFPIIFVSDMKRSLSFYRDVLGVPLKFETPHWTEFGSGGTTLALHISEDPNPDQVQPQHPPAGRCRPGFGVPDIDEFHRKMLKHDVPCIQEPQDVFGVRVAQYADPDGLTFSIGEEKNSG